MTEPPPHLPPGDEADLVALADDRLSPERWDEVLARLADEPGLGDELARQRRALGMLAAANVAAPVALRERIEALAVDAPRRRSRRFAVLAVALVAATAVFVSAMATPAPVLGDVVSASLLPPTSAATTDDGLAYAGWRATGARSDVVGGRRMRTVFYTRDEVRIAYTIVAGPPLADTPGVRAFPAPDGWAAVTWTRHGRTCVLSSAAVDDEALASIAASTS